MKLIIKLSSEISIKGRVVRKKMITILIKNIKTALKKIISDFDLKNRWDHLLLEVSEKFSHQIIHKLKNIPGISFFQKIEEFPFLNFEDTSKKIYKLHAEKIIGKKFCVRVKRTGHHDFRSVDLEKYLGGVLKNTIEKSRIDLSNPEYTVSVEIKNKILYLPQEKIMGQGGFPVGTNERVLMLISGGYDSGVAAYQMIKKGCPVDFLFFNLGGAHHRQGVEKLSQYLTEKFSNGHSANFFAIPFEKIMKELSEKVQDRYRGVVLKRMMFRVANIIAQNGYHKAIITGESLGQVSSQTFQNLENISSVSKIPIYRPLFAFQKPDIIKIAREIDTEKFAKDMPEYCGVLSKSPATKAKTHHTEWEEENFNMRLLEEAFEKKEIVKLTQQLTAGLASTHESTSHPNNKDENQYSRSSEIPEVTKPLPEEIVIDIREPEERADFKLPKQKGKILEIPFFELEKNYEILDTEKTYLLFCERGVVSKNYAEEMRGKGFRMKVLRIKN